MTTGIDFSGPAAAAERLRVSPLALDRVRLWAGCLIPFAAAVHLVLWYWPGAVPLDVTSGVWTAFARDFADGILYRPLFGPAGYGGTRYMPLFFAAHGALMRLGLDPVASGMSLTLASAALFDAVLYIALRELDVRPSVALPLALLGSAPVSVQLITIGVKCDLLASALNLGGVALVLRYARRPRTVTLSAGLLALVAAVFTKFTTVSGLIAAFLLIRARRGPRVARAAAGAVAALIACGLLAVSLASGGRFWTSFAAVGSGGGDWAYALRFPFWFALLLVEDPCGLVLFLAALHAAVTVSRRPPLAFAIRYFWIVLALTVPVFASPGTDNNHLVDLFGASILVLGDQIEHRPTCAKWALAAPGAVSVLTLATLVPGMLSVQSVVTAMGKPERRTIAGILAGAGPPERILSENPIVPVLGGARPIVADPFSLRILAARRPDIADDFARRVGAGAFGTVVLVDWSRASARDVMAAMAARSDRGVDRFYGGVRFPPRFLETLAQRYTVAAVDHPFVVLKRRP